MAEVILFGLGKMGEAAGRHYFTRGFNVRAVDSDPRKKEVADKFSSSFTLLEDSSLIGGFLVADIWHIATPTSTHFNYLNAAKALGIPKVYLEKPSVDNVLLAATFEARRETKPLVQVGYVETQNPVLLTILSDMELSRFIPFESIHRRSSNILRETAELGQTEVPEAKRSHVRHDGVHDIANAELIFLETTGWSLDQAQVISNEVTSWKDKYGEKHPWDQDVAARFTLLYPDGNKATIEGQADFDHQRGFVVINKSHELAYVGQTLNREGIHPFAAKLEGWGSVQTFFDQVSREPVWNPRYLRNMVMAKRGKFLDLSRYTQDPLDRMIQNLIGSFSSDELFCPLSKAIDVESVANSI